MEKSLQIDIDKIIKEKAGDKAKWVPSFAISYMKRIVHQDELNEIFRLYGHLKGIDFIHACFDYLDIKYSSKGLENIPKDGRYMFASNHPFGGMDGMMILDELNSKLGASRVIANDILMNVTPLQELFIPVNKHGSQSRVIYEQLKEAMSSEQQIVTFPAGLCSRVFEGKIADTEWKTTFIKEAITNRRDVVPVYFDGQLSKFFYRLYRIRKALGIKFNIEMLYLVDELMRQRGGRFTISFGSPIEWQRLEQFSASRAAAEHVRAELYKMA